MRRREFVKHDLKPEYAVILSASVPINEKLFGGVVSKILEEIDKSNKLTNKAVVQGNWRGQRGRRPFRGYRGSGYPRGFGGYHTGSYMPQQRGHFCRIAHETGEGQGLAMTSTSTSTEIQCDWTVSAEDDGGKVGGGPDGAVVDNVVMVPTTDGHAGRLPQGTAKNAEIVDAALVNTATSTPSKTTADTVSVVRRSLESR